MNHKDEHCSKSPDDKQKKCSGVARYKVHLLWHAWGCVKWNTESRPGIIVLWFWTDEESGPGYFNLKPQRRDTIWWPHYRFCELAGRKCQLIIFILILDSLHTATWSTKVKVTLRELQKFHGRSKVAPVALFSVRDEGEMTGFRRH